MRCTERSEGVDSAPRSQYDIVLGVDLAYIVGIGGLSYTNNPFIIFDNHVDLPFSRASIVFLRAICYFHFGRERHYPAYSWASGHVLMLVPPVGGVLGTSIHCFIQYVHHSLAYSPGSSSEFTKGRCNCTVTWSIMVSNRNSFRS